MAAALLTIGDLVELETLRTAVVAGQAGLARRVTWAHSCELEEPWNWLAPGELLLTVGFCVPAGVQEQVQFVRLLDRAGVAAASIGWRSPELVLSDDMLAEANRLGFPILRTEPDVPWVAISRHVAAASEHERVGEILTLTKLYEFAATVETLQQLLDGIAELLRVETQICDLESGRVLVNSAQPDPASAPTVPRAVNDGEAPLSRVRRHRLPAALGLELETTELPGRAVSAMVLVHVQRLVEVQIERALLALELQSKSWSAALAHLAQHGDATPLSAFSDGDAHRIAVFEQGAIARVLRVAALAQPGVIVGRSGGRGLVVFAAATFEEVRELLSVLALDAGVSRSFTAWETTAAAITEAEIAFADGGGSGVIEFAQFSLGLLSRTEREAQRIIDEALGSLTCPGKRTAELRKTLFAYLRHDRSWSDTAAELQIHKQTLAYRLRRIEAETGRSLKRSEDIAALWVAMQAWLRVHSEN